MTACQWLEQHYPFSKKEKETTAYNPALIEYEQRYRLKYLVQSGELKDFDELSDEDFVGRVSEDLCTSSVLNRIH